MNHSLEQQKHKSKSQHISTQEKGNEANFLYILKLFSKFLIVKFRIQMEISSVKKSAISAKVTSPQCEKHKRCFQNVLRMKVNSL